MTLFSQLTQRLAQSDDGRLSKHELEQLRQSRGDARFILEDLIMRADANTDGKIGFDDSANMLCSYAGK